MPQEGIWLPSEVSDEPIFMPYSEMETEARQMLIKPIGGFFYKANEFMELDLPPTPYYIKDWLPKRGRCVIYAPAKAGKSFMVLQVARAIASGTPFLGFPTTKGRVMLIQFELGAEVLQGRMIGTGKNYADVYVGTTFSLKIDTDDGLRRIKEAATAIDPDVIIFDPLYKMMSGDENETSDMKKVVDNLDQLIEGWQCSIFLTHHSGKDVSKGGRGSSVLEDWVDSYIEMKRISKQGEALKVTFNPKSLRHAQLPPEIMTAEMRNYEFQQVTEDETVKGQIKKYIKGKFEDAGTGVSRKEILDIGIGSNTSVQEALNELCEEYVIAKEARGEYIWNEEV